VIDYCLPEIPCKYWVTSIKCICKSCGHSFDLLLPKGDEIIKYQECNGNEIRWLPTYGKGGYLYLMVKLIPGFSVSDDVTMQLAKEFNKKLQLHIEPSNNGKLFTLADKYITCSKCKSKSIDFGKETVLVTPNLEWLKISCELMDK
jgi:hypothetical protein